MESVRRSVYGETWWQGTIKETENKGAYLEDNPFFDWQPVKCLEQWSNSNIFISAVEKNNICCMVLNFLQPVHLITVNVNEQRVAVVQPTENKTTHQLSNGFCC